MGRRRSVSLNFYLFHMHACDLFLAAPPEGPDLCKSQNNAKTLLARRALQRGIRAVRVLLECAGGQYCPFCHSAVNLCRHGRTLSAFALKRTVGYLSLPPLEEDAPHQQRLSHPNHTTILARVAGLAMILSSCTLRAATKPRYNGYKVLTRQ